MEAKTALEVTNKVVSTGYTYILIECSVPLRRQRGNVGLIRSEKDDAADCLESLLTEPLKILEELKRDFGDIKT